jgi:exosortase family protein XrtF
MKKLLLEFKLALLFLAKFLGIYLIGSVLYLLWLNIFIPYPDPITEIVTAQSSHLLNMWGYRTHTFIHKSAAIVSIVYNGNSVVSVYEGCNGVNVMIIFLGFIIAFSPVRKLMIFFVISGLGILHVVNLFRVAGLFLVADHFPTWLYFTHKYLFSLIIYSITFLLWYLWIRISKKIT